MSKVKIENGLKYKESSYDEDVEISCGNEIIEVGKNSFKIITNTITSRPGVPGNYKAETEGGDMIIVFDEENQNTIDFDKTGCQSVGDFYKELSAQN